VEDLNFNVSVISDAPITSETVMATLLQVLRINGMYLLEEKDSLVIHKSPNVRQVGAIVSEDGKPTNAPIVTRIFNIKNAPLDSIAAIIRPMISTDALIEVTPDSRLLILTDITASVDKVAALIEVLDSPHHPLEIKAYETLNNEPEFLIEMASQIMAPISQGNPFLLVPQPMANAIFIVSTPALVESPLSNRKIFSFTKPFIVLPKRSLKISMMWEIV
jgi:type III secretion protein C